MANYDDNNRGVLFVNDKRKNDKQPQYKGSATVNGVEYWLSAWQKKSQNGTAYMSISFEPKEQEKDDDLPEFLR